jgi:tetratricopeptide (TPR) repeat protein
MLTINRCRCASLLVLGLILGLALPGRGADAPKKITIQDLEKITGSEKVKEEELTPRPYGFLAIRKALLEDRPGTKKLIDEGLAMLKDKKSMSYNAALVLALVAGEMKDLKASEAFFRVCMAQAAKLQSTKKIIESYGGLIDLFSENKKYPESARVCQELLELKTDDGKPREYLIWVPSKNFRGDGFEPLDSYDPARGIKPIVHRMLIESIVKQGKFEQALKMVDNLIKKTKHWKERALRGQVLTEAGKVADAVKVYEQVIDQIGKDEKLEPEDRETYQKRYRYLLSNLFVDLKQIDKASEYLQTLLAKHPDDPGFNNDLGYIWADHDMKLPEAEKLIRKALELDRKRRKADPTLKAEQDSDNGAYLDSLGWVLFKQKKYKEAKEALIEAVKDKKSQHIEIYDHLGDVHMALGEREAAIAAWKKGIEVVGEGRRDQERRAIVEKKLQMNK